MPTLKTSQIEGHMQLKEFSFWNSNVLGDEDYWKIATLDQLSEGVFICWCKAPKIAWNRRRCKKCRIVQRVSKIPAIVSSLKEENFTSHLAYATYSRRRLDSSQWWIHLKYYSSWRLPGTMGTGMTPCTHIQQENSCWVCTQYKHLSLCSNYGHQINPCSKRTVGLYLQGRCSR